MLTQCLRKVWYRGKKKNPPLLWLVWITFNQSQSSLDGAKPRMTTVWRWSLVFSKWLREMQTKRKRPMKKFIFGVWCSRTWCTCMEPQPRPHLAPFGWIGTSVASLASSQPSFINVSWGFSLVPIFCGLPQRSGGCCSSKASANSILMPLVLKWDVPTIVQYMDATYKCLQTSVVITAQPGPNKNGKQRTLQQRTG